MEDFFPTEAEIRAHVAFLRAAHEQVLVRDTNTATAAAVAQQAARYVEWLRAAAADGGGVMDTPPPLAEAWFWHCHRLAPHKYLADCRALGGIVEPGPQAVFAWAAADATAISCASTPAAASTDVEGVCAQLVEDLVARSERQARFLWQVSGEAYADAAFLADAVLRYDKFLRIAGANGQNLAPPIDVDLVWHTHMLRGGVKTYLAETTAHCGVEVDHNDNVGDERLDGLWQNTTERWVADSADSPDPAQWSPAASRATNPKISAVDDSTATAIATATATATGRARASETSLAVANATRPGATWRGEVPPWWFDKTAPIAVVEDDFVSPEEIEAILAQMPRPEDAVVGGGGAAHGCGFGTDARCTVTINAELERRIRERVSTRLGMEPPIDLPLAAASASASDTASALAPTLDTASVQTSAAELQLPARVAVGKMRAHRDRLAVVQPEDKPEEPLPPGTDMATLGPYADSYVVVVYLHGRGSLLLEADADNGAWVPQHALAALHQMQIDVKPGRLVAWPNFAVLHSGRTKTDPKTGDGTVCQQSLEEHTRWILGPVALLPGRGRVAQSGDCGGGCESAPRRPAPDPPTNSRFIAADYAGQYKTSCCPTCAEMTLTPEGPDEFSVRAFVCCFPLCFPCWNCGYYVRESDEGDFVANGGSSQGKFVFSDDRRSVTWSYCWTGKMLRQGEPGPAHPRPPRLAQAGVVGMQPKRLPPAMLAWNVAAVAEFASSAVCPPLGKLLASHNVSGTDLPLLDESALQAVGVPPADARSFILAIDRQATAACGGHDAYPPPYTPAVAGTAIQ